MINLFLIGCSELAKDILENIQSSNWFLKRENNKEKNLFFADLEEIFFIDASFKEKEYLGYSVLNSIDEIETKNNLNLFIITFSSIRNQLFREAERLKYINHGFTEISLISITSYISKSSKVETGCIISQGVYLGPFSEVKNNSIVLFNTVISRNTIVNRNCFISANVTVTANRNINKNAYIGAGTLIDANVGECSIIGSGSIVKREVENFTIFDGSTNQSKRALSLKNKIVMKKARENL